jgi:hypothetical protein
LALEPVRIAVETVREELLGASYQGGGVASIDTDELILQAHKRAMLRKTLVALVLEPPGLDALKAVVSQCPDVALASTALTMLLRPRWVLDLVGAC